MSFFKASPVGTLVQQSAEHPTCSGPIVLLWYVCTTPSPQMPSLSPSFIPVPSQSLLRPEHFATCGARLLCASCKHIFPSLIFFFLFMKLIYTYSVRFWEWSTCKKKIQCVVSCDRVVTGNMEVQILVPSLPHTTMSRAFLHFRPQFSLLKGGNWVPDR